MFFFRVNSKLLRSGLNESGSAGSDVIAFSEVAFVVDKNNFNSLLFARLGPNPVNDLRLAEGRHHWFIDPETLSFRNDSLTTVYHNVADQSKA